MDDRRRPEGHDGPELLGADPDRPARARATFALSPDAVRAMLTAPSLPATLDALGIAGADADELRALIPVAVDDSQVLTAVTARANALRAEAGLDAPLAHSPEADAADDAAQRAIAPGEGLVTILAHLVSTDTVRAWHAARGIPAGISWASLADLGQQIAVHRVVHGRLGLGTRQWTSLVWTGQVVRLGRLQHQLRIAHGDGADAHWDLSVHIPATGPLAPEDVDASLTMARDVLGERFADLGAGRPAELPAFGTEFHCRSWLLSPALAEILGPEANLARFAARWRLEETYDASDDVVFFVFARPRGTAPTDLDTDTRLRRAIRERLLAGGGWTGGSGHLVLGAVPGEASRAQTATAPESM